MVILKIMMLCIYYNIIIPIQQPAPSTRTAHSPQPGTKYASARNATAGAANPKCCNARSAKTTTTKAAWTRPRRPSSSQDSAHSAITKN